MNYVTTRKNSYTLQSFVVHQGSLGGGHYFAVCKNQLDGLWRKYNDSHVSVVKKEDLQKFTPYLFFYKRL